MVGILESAALVLKSLHWMLHLMSCLWSGMVSYLVSAFVNDLKNFRCCGSDLGMVEHWIKVLKLLYGSCTNE